MLLLLPPSEAKARPTHGEPVDLAGLSCPELTSVRQRLLDAVVRTSARPDATALLGVGASVADDVAHNTTLRTAPTAPAGQVYTGVLYAAAGLDRLRGRAAERAERTVRIASGLWGVVGAADRIPAYRLPMGADLPDVGPLARVWREPLARTLDPLAAEHLVVDCRSGGYAAAWRGASRAQGARERTARPGHVEVRVLSETDGVRTVVSHWAKQARGVLTRHLLTRRGAEPSTPERLRDAAGELVGGALLDVDLQPAAGGRHVLWLVVPGLPARG